jgi:hypothetical protein
MLQVMILLLTPVLVGVVAGYAVGGRFANIETVRFRALWLLWSAAVVQAAQYYLAPLRRFLQDDLGVSMLAIVFAIVSLWVALNAVRWSRPMQLAAGLIVMGAIVNGLVIAANGRMPYAPQAAVRAHLPATVTDPKHQPADHDTRLALLGDVIPVRPLGKIISAGDLLIAVGVSAAVAMALRGRGVVAAGQATAIGVRPPAGFGSDPEEGVSPEREGGEHEADDQLDPRRLGAVCPGDPALHHRRDVPQRGLKG